MAVGTMPENGAVEEPAHLQCPVLQTLYNDPVFVVESGNTYERSAILAYWATADAVRDPLTNAILPNREVRTNWGVRREVQAFLDAHPGYLPDGWESRDLGPADPLSPQPPSSDVPQGAADQAGGEVLPAACRQHCAALARAHGGRLPEQIIVQVAGHFGVSPALVREAFAPPEGGVAGHAVGRPPMDNAHADVPEAVRVHCDAVAQAHGGVVPEAVLRHFAAAHGIDAAVLSALYGPPVAAQ
eukprot:TRINITY_DN45086_c0_g1_i1.p2 TRINITY_DN45086_c0_g1~~TRINITY_DN45086_c0_g1_i1.p2  ORF type:complete len:243 (-),score=23.57 TRINITY_DN45086_c0_g1_i1:140-868(-)